MLHIVLIWLVVIAIVAAVTPLIFLLAMLILSMWAVMFEEISGWFE